MEILEQISNVVTETQEKQVLKQLACLKKNFEASENNCQMERRREHWPAAEQQK